ncbi:MAG: transposase [Candidatus Omnitrophota bacterium]|nr:transposase [Candidatus Omnitrophota bacterium]MBU1928459.1 transposase [Candidatus Omnitrophota bacterium]MBU2035468.1 transposase [Candidatus Omnitrophota bacterium]MBU2257514.1 transposase [Candidatus Omnitrophota bacterium]
MTRIARVVARGLPHHITQRGNYQQDVFSDVHDRKQYLEWIKEYSKQYGLCILAYCLMQNHVHFVGIPAENDSLAKTFNIAHMRYAQYFNKKLQQRGHLWQGRFYSCALDEAHLILAVRYVERNPVRAGLVKKPWEWEWSSALAHTNQQKDKIFEFENFFEITGMSYNYWRNYIDYSEEGNILQNIRKYTLTGRPLGTSGFIETLEKNLHKRLFQLPVGRPKEE